jgi:hypothetical protein
VVGLGGGAAVHAPPSANVTAAGSFGVAAGMQRAGGARRAPPPPTDSALPRMGSEGITGPPGSRVGASEVQRQQRGHCRDRHARAVGLAVQLACWSGPRGARETAIKGSSVEEAASSVFGLLLELSWRQW